jgi:selenide,water dikinase
VLSQLPKNEGDKLNNLLVGLETSDDAAVYKINDETALIQTLDFFTPMVDDPYTFGQVAACNSLSDVYAMGGEPTVAMNIVCFPACHDMSVLAEIMKGGMDKVKESGALLVGGHTVDDDVPKYGLSVSGIVHPDKILANTGAKVGDKLILTKPIGVGILTTAMKEDLVDEDRSNKVIETLIHLNKYAAMSFKNFEVNSATDITGFGFVGHALEMAKGSEVTIEIDSKNVPILDGAVEMAEMGIIPEGMYRNMYFAEKDIEVVGGVSQSLTDVFHDPQSSGGLLVSVRADLAEMMADDMKKNGSMEAKIVGRVVEKGEKYIRII